MPAPTAAWPTFMYPRLMRSLNDALQFDALTAAQASLNGQMVTLTNTVTSVQGSIAQATNDSSSALTIAQNANAAALQAQLTATGAASSASGAVVTANSAATSAAAATAAAQTATNAIALKADLVSGRVALTQLPAFLSYITVTAAVNLDTMLSRINALDAAVILKGGWDASGGVFPGSGTAQAGESWIITSPGTIGGVSFSANDRVLAIVDNASTSTYANQWLKLDYTDQVLSVAGMTGAVTLTSANLTDVSAFARTILDDGDAATARTTLGLAIGSNVQAYSAGLGQIAALGNPAGNRLLFWNGSTNSYDYLSIGANLTISAGALVASGGGGGGSLGDGDYGDIIVSGGATGLNIDSTVLTAFGRTLIDDANASAARTTLGLAIGTNVQAYSSVLAATTASFLTAQETKLGFLTVTGSINLDTINTRINQLDAAVILKGGWAANAGTFPGGGTAQAGESYIVTTPGTVNGVDFNTNDRVLAILDNASSTVYASNWLKLDYTDQVLSVAGRSGAITLTSADLTDVSAFARTILDDTSAGAVRATINAAALTGGNTFTGNQFISSANAALSIDKLASGQGSALVGSLNGVARWNLSVGDATAEGGANAGSDFTLYRYADNGVYLGIALQVYRATGDLYVGGSLAATAANMETVLPSRLRASNPSSVTGDMNAVTSSGFYRLGTSLTNGPGGVDYGQLIVSRGSDTLLQIAADYASSKMAWRSGSGIGDTPVFGSWRTLIHDGNISSYAVSLSGTNSFSGSNTFGAATTFNSYAFAVGSTGTVAALSGTQHRLEVRSASGADAAFMAFHIPGVYASGFGLGIDGKWYVGGWSAGAGQNAIYHEGFKPPAGSSVQEFASSGTWTKPSTGTMAIIEIWGAGGSGAKGTASGGGGGGAYLKIMKKLSELGSTETVTLGAGGAAVSSGNGNTGGNSAFGAHAVAYGGAGGQTANGNGGGGGGIFAAGSSFTGGLGGASSSAGGTGGNGSVPTPPLSSDWGGGGGGANGGGGQTAGGRSAFGGGGGGGGTQAGGTSLQGGAGGAGGANGIAGSAKGGGGGAATSGTSGAGGAGYCRVTVV